MILSSSLPFENSLLVTNVAHKIIIIKIRKFVKKIRFIETNRRKAVRTEKKRKTQKSNFEERKDIFNNLGKGILFSFSLGRLLHRIIISPNEIPTRGDIFSYCKARTIGTKKTVSYIKTRWSMRVICDCCLCGIKTRPNSGYTISIEFIPVLWTKIQARQSKRGGQHFFFWLFFFFQLRF